MMFKRATSTRWSIRILIVSIAIAACVLPGALILAQGEDTRYFEETGHNVASEFLQFYELHGGRAIFGYPLTRRFQENGRWVQYFQRVRMESHPENPDPYKVQLGLLGDELGYRQSPIPESEIPPPTHSDKKHFPQTGHTVSFAFLEFYNDNGGLDVFGYPITEWVIEPNGRIVQYFQRGKMEWYPEHPPGQRVQLGMLGTIYVEQFVDPIYRQREDPRIGPRSPTQPAQPTEGLPAVAFSVTDLRVVVTLKHPIIGLRGTQTAYVYVFDQANHGVPGATIDMSVHYKGGRVDQFSLGPTNANGYAQIDFPVGEATPGYVVIVNLQAGYRDVQSEVSTAFLPWW